MSFSYLLRPQLASYTCRSCLVRLSRASRRPQSHSTRSFDSKKPKTTLPTAPARTRFAPSPTGYLHLGSIRTALFNYLLAKRTGGQFLLRIEDTDQKRTVPDAEARLFQDLRWAGLQWDEGPEVGGLHGPYKQSERSALYREHAQKLLDNGHAYRCFCSPKRLRKLAEFRHTAGLPTDYDRTCAGISKEESDNRAYKHESHVVRLRMPDTSPKYADLIYGTFKPFRPHRSARMYEDPILLKSDGLPTYHLANVVDDYHMDITHVIRGTEWMASTPKHIIMYDAFGWKPPKFAHVGLLVDDKGNKLSKRNFDTDISAFREMEIFPETLINFAALLGWSHQEKSDIMDLATLVKNFSMKFTKGNSTVTFGKLHFLQRKHAALRVTAGGQGLQEMVHNVVRILRDPDGSYQEWQRLVRSPLLSQYVEKIIKADFDNYTNANEFVYRNSYMFAPLRHPQSFTDAEDISKRVKRLAEVEEWDTESLKSKLHEIIDARPEGKEGSKDVYTYLRKALTGRYEGMRIYDVMVLLGREECLRRLGVRVQVD